MSAIDEVATGGNSLNINRTDALDGVIRIVEQSTGYVVVHEDGTRFELDSDLTECSCGECQELTRVKSAGDARDVEGPVVHMGMGWKSHRRERRSAQCRHANAVEDALKQGPCGECGHNVHGVREYTDSHGMVVMDEKQCTECGHTLE